MRLSQAVGKLARNDLQGFNPVSGLWEPLPFKAQLANSGRWIGRSEDFYNRRVLLTPEAIPAPYEVIRLGDAEREYLVFAHQPNVQANQQYLFDYTILDIEPNYAELWANTPTLSASGIGGKKVLTKVGDFPVAFDRYASSSSTFARDVGQSKFNGYIPTYAGAATENFLVLNGEHYDIKECSLQMSLTNLQMVKR